MFMPEKQKTESSTAFCAEALLHYEQLIKSAILTQISQRHVKNWCLSVCFLSLIKVYLLTYVAGK